MQQTLESQNLQKKLQYSLRSAYIGVAPIYITNYTVLDIILKNNLMQQTVEFQDLLGMELL